MAKLTKNETTGNTSDSDIMGNVLRELTYYNIIYNYGSKHSSPPTYNWYSQGRYFSAGAMNPLDFICLTLSDDDLKNYLVQATYDQLEIYLQAHANLYEKAIQQNQYYASNTTDLYYPQAAPNKLTSLLTDLGNELDKITKDDNTQTRTKYFRQIVHICSSAFDLGTRSDIAEIYKKLNTPINQLRPLLVNDPKALSSLQKLINFLKAVFTIGILPAYNKRKYGSFFPSASERLLVSAVDMARKVAAQPAI